MMAWTLFEIDTFFSPLARDWLEYICALDDAL